jgi:phospholipid/cholesterol/gamma-HCH transport system substrate-binding protein
MAQLGGTVDAVTSISAQLEQVAKMLAQDGKLEVTVKNFSRTSEELRLAVSENRALLRETLDNVAAASRTTRALTTGRESQLGKTLDNFSSAAEKMDVLAGRLDSLRAVLQVTAGRVEQGQGTVGKLVNDDELYKRLNESVGELRDLIADIKKNPKKYFKFSVF